MQHVQESQSGTNPTRRELVIKDMKEGSSQLVDTIISGGDYMAKFEVLWKEFVVKHGVPVPNHVPADASEDLKWGAARDRLMNNFGFHGRAALRSEAHRLIPLLNHHLANIIDMVRYFDQVAPEEADADHVEDVAMVDGEAECEADRLSSAFSNLRVSE